MEILSFDSKKEFIYHWCGKFVAPDSSWVHLTRWLTDFELIAVTEGTLHIADALHEYTVSAGEYLLMTPTLHQYGTSPSKCSFYWMHFGYNNEKNDFMTAPGDAVYSPGYLLIPRYGKLSSFDRIIILMKQLQDSDKRYREATLNRYICAAVLSEIAAQSYPFKSETRTTETQLINDVKDYIGWHIAEGIKITEVAEYFGYNPKYLTSLFKKITGTSLKQFELQKKMEQAARILSETNLPVAQIAYRLGFDDAHNSSNAFKKVMAASPSEYRESYAKRQTFNT